MTEEKPDIELIYDHYGLRITGSDSSLWRKAQCPLPEHDDRDPSASVNTDENKFWCHACGRGGDSFQIIKERESLARWADVVAFGARFTDGSDVQVQQRRGGSGLLPRGAGHRPNRGAWVPPWKGL